MQAINDFIMSLIYSVTGLTTEKEEGQTLVEYALIIALIAIVCAAALTTLAGGISGVYSSIVSHFGS